MLTYTPRLKAKARSLRSRLTDAERRLWARVRRKQILGVQFYRQKAIGNYIVDFYAPAAKLVVEVDGSQHFQPRQAQHDRRRSAYLEQEGLRVLRFTDRQVLLELRSVVEVIFQAVKDKNPPSPPFAKGENNNQAITRGKVLLLGCFVLLLSSISLAAQPSSPQVDSLLRKGQQALDAGSFNAAAENFEQARSLEPENPEAWRGLLLSYLQGKKPAEAVAVGREAVERWPEASEFRHWLGLAYFQGGEAAAALEQLAEAKRLEPTRYEIRFDLALVYLSTQQYEPAAQELEDAIRLNPDVALAHILLGRAYQNTNRTLPAVEQFQAALRLDPQVPLGHYHLGFAYESLGRDREAVAEFKQEVAQGRDNSEVFYRLGHVLLKTGEFQEAANNLRRSIALGARNALAYYDLGKALVALGNTQEATEALRRAIRLEPSNPGPHYQLARALERQGKKSEARAEYEQFAELQKRQKQTGGMAFQPN
jgi:very-short-patch-repair endonuclease/tetratricopeptide (TPR) repeat protein